MTATSSMEGRYPDDRISVYILATAKYQSHSQDKECCAKASGYAGVSIMSVGFGTFHLYWRVSQVRAS